MTIQSATITLRQYMYTVGVLCVDDGTYSVGHTDPAILSQKLSDQYEKISDYMAGNKLVINGDKTHLVVMGTKHTAAHRDEVKLEAGPHTILPSTTEKLLGGRISQDLKWNQHILEGDQSLVKQITSRINGLCMLSTRSSFQTRLMVANGIVISQLCYLIQLWGGCEGYLLNSLQIIMNRVCDWVQPLHLHKQTFVHLQLAKCTAVGLQGAQGLQHDPG